MDLSRQPKWAQERGYEDTTRDYYPTFDVDAATFTAEELAAARSVMEYRRPLDAEYTTLRVRFADGSLSYPVLRIYDRERVPHELQVHEAAAYMRQKDTRCPECPPIPSRKEA